LIGNVQTASSRDMLVRILCFDDGHRRALHDLKITVIDWLLLKIIDWHDLFRQLVHSVHPIINITTIESIDMNMMYKK